MPSAQTPPEPASVDSLISGLGDGKAVRKPKANKPEAAKIEPTMRALRRILGDEILDIFPDGLMEQVDNIYQLCQEEAELWLDVPYDTVEDRNDTLALMRAYAECAGDSGYTIRQDRTAEPTTLRFRVQNRRGSGKSSSGDDD